MHDRRNIFRTVLNAFMWIVPAVVVLLVLWGVTTYRSMIRNESAGMGTLSIFHLIGSLTPFTAFFLTNIFRNKIVALSLYVFSLAAIVYLLYWDRLSR